jgi:hypothetical protein
MLAQQYQSGPMSWSNCFPNLPLSRNEDTYQLPPSVMVDLDPTVGKYGTKKRSRQKSLTLSLRQVKVSKR